MKNEKIIEGLNELLAKNYDSEKGYKNAAEKSENPLLTSFYKNKASQRYSFGHQIKRHIVELGGEPEKGTSVLGDLHNSWINLKTAVSFDKEDALLDAIEEGEEACVNDYKEFLDNNDLPGNVRSTIAQQYTEVRNALRRVEHFEDQVD